MKVFILAVIKYSLYFVSFTFEISEEELINEKAKLANITNKAVGIDLGIKSALTLSVPINIHFPVRIKKENRKLIKLSRQLDRKVHPRTKEEPKATLLRSLRII